MNYRGSYPVIALLDADRDYFDRILSVEVSDVDATSDKYATAFGFTEEEMFAALDECGLSDQKEKVKIWRR